MVLCIWAKAYLVLAWSSYHGPALAGWQPIPLTGEAPGGTGQRRSDCQWQGPVGEDYEKHEGAAGIPFGVEAGSVGAHCTLFTAAWSDVAAEQGGECGIEGKDLGLSLGVTTA
jgi:hypothetical protein